MDEVQLAAETATMSGMSGMSEVSGVSEDVELDEELLVEEISIDGMCGVY